jgi:hypothetical protein
MAYGKSKVKQTYAQPRRPLRHSVYSPVHHATFRTEWESNLEPAIAKVQALKNEGYMADEALQRGALTESQAERFASRLKELGCEIQIIPIATWAGEKVVFLVYKPPKEPVQQQQPEAKPPPSLKQPASPEEYLQRFLKEFYDDNDPRVPEEANRFKNEGWAMDPQRIMAVINKDAPGKAGPDSLLGMAKSLHGSVPLASFPKANDVMTALRRAKGSKSHDYDYVAWAPDILTSIDYARKALKILGPKTPIRVCCEKKQSPIYFMDPNGNAVVVAPALDVDKSTVIDVNTLMRYYGPS